MDSATSHLLEHSQYLVAKSQAIATNLKRLADRSHNLIEQSRGLALNLIAVQEADTRPRSR